LKIRLFYLLILFLLTTKLSWSAEESFVKAYYDQNRVFYVTGLAEGEWIETSRFQIFLFKSAAQTCRIDATKIKKEFSQLNQKFWQILNQYYPKAEEEFLELPLKISIDHFEPQKANPGLGGFFLPDQPSPDENLIVLDCRFFQGDYWKALLGHEIIHALLDSKNAPSWAEELLAQNVEHEISQKWPNLRLNHLAQQFKVPSPLTSERPFLTSSRYASNFLLGQYLLKRWGGLSVLRALLPQVEVESCPPPLSDINVLCRIKWFLVKMNASPELQERSTLPGLLRHFAVALVLNQFNESSQGLYSIPGWQGFISPAFNNENVSEINKIKLEKGSFLRLNPMLWFRYQNQWNPQLEAYRIITYAEGSYEIRELNKIPQKLTRKARQDTVILLNVSHEQTLPVFLQ